LPHGKSPAVTPGIRHVRIWSSFSGLEQKGGHDEDTPRVIPLSDGQQSGDVWHQTGVPEPHERERNEGTDDEDESNES